MKLVLNDAKSIIDDSIRMIKQKFELKPDTEIIITSGKKLKAGKFINDAKLALKTSIDDAERHYKLMMPDGSKSIENATIYAIVVTTNTNPEKITLVVPVGANLIKLLMPKITKSPKTPNTAEHDLEIIENAYQSRLITYQIAIFYQKSKDETQTELLTNLTKITGTISYRFNYKNTLDLLYGFKIDMKNAPRNLQIEIKQRKKHYHSVINIQFLHYDDRTKTLDIMASLD